MEAGGEISRAELAVEILRELDVDYARICGGKFSAGCGRMGGSLRDHRPKCGGADGRAANSRLRRIAGRRRRAVVRTEHGHLERVIGGDVTLEK